MLTKVIHGANDGYFPVVGFSVASVRASLVDAFNIPNEAVSFVNGVTVDRSYRLCGGEVVEFMKRWGRKGAIDLPGLPISTYGTIDITDGIPAGCVHVDLPRVGVTCKRLGIEYAKAVVDWNEFGGRRNRKRYPAFSGVVVRKHDQAKLLEAIARKQAKHSKKAERLPVLAALFTLNRRAKRCRDLAQRYYQRGMHGFAGQMRREKVRIYDLKGQVLHNMVEAGVLVGGKYHRFEFGNWAEVLDGGGYTFHRPCPPPQNDDSGQIAVLESIEAKPKGTKEPAIQVAFEVVEKFLEDKQRVGVYQWPAVFRGRTGQRWNSEEEDEESEYDDDEYHEE